MRTVDLIVKKRNEECLSEKEIEFLINGYVNKEITDYQMSAFCMAVYFNGMTVSETHSLTRAMLYSGEQIDLSGISLPKIDKHSTGGVGDKISIILAPVAAACGLVVPMMCGRGLGHTGGTIDKMEAIPGYSTALSQEKMKKILSETGFVIMGQTESIAPADKLLYALRDVTGTVESIPLITASILSKKLAEGADGFVFDVKAGNGAFMKNVDDAKKLAESLVSTTQAFGKKASACITEMNAPLGRMVGNLCEVAESLECLEGNMPDDIKEVTLELAAEMLIIGGCVDNVREGRQRAEEKIADKTAYDLLLKNIELQGGDPSLFEKNHGFSIPKKTAVLKADKSGYIHEINACKIGIASMMLGAGRSKKDDIVLPDAGIELFTIPGKKVTAGEDLCILFTSAETDLDEAVKTASDAFIIKEDPKEKSLIMLGKVK